MRWEPRMLSSILSFFVLRVAPMKILCKTTYKPPKLPKCCLFLVALWAGYTFFLPGCGQPRQTLISDGDSSSALSDESILNVLGGTFTCCSRCHPGDMPCDRHKTRDVLLGILVASWVPPFSRNFFFFLGGGGGGMLYEIGGWPPNIVTKNHNEVSRIS